VYKSILSTELIDIHYHIFIVFLDVTESLCGFSLF